MSTQAQRVLVTGWPSFLHGDAAAGDVLAMQAVAAQLDTAGVPHEIAWSPVFRPGQLTLEAADPARYSHLVFACGPLSGLPIEALHERFAGCRRVAIGVSVIDPADPAAAGFHAILARDSPGEPPTIDLAAVPRPPLKPVAGVIQVGEQREYPAAGGTRPFRRAWPAGCPAAGAPCFRWKPGSTPATGGCAARLPNWSPLSAGSTL